MKNKIAQLAYSNDIENIKLSELLAESQNILIYKSYGSGSGDGSGYGFGSGDGYGYGSGDGSGYGFGDGDGLAEFARRCKVVNPTTYDSCCGHDRTVLAIFPAVTHPRSAAIFELHRLGACAWS